MEDVFELCDLVAPSDNVDGDLAVAHLVFDLVHFVLQVKRLLGLLLQQRLLLIELLNFVLKVLIVQFSQVLNLLT